MLIFFLNLLLDEPLAAMEAHIAPPSPVVEVKSGISGDEVPVVEQKQVSVLIYNKQVR